MSLLLRLLLGFLPTTLHQQRARPVVSCLTLKFPRTNTWMSVQTHNRLHSQRVSTTCEHQRLHAAVVRPNLFRWPVGKLAGCLRWLNLLHNPPAGSIWLHVPGETVRAQSTQPDLTLCLSSVCTAKPRHTESVPGCLFFFFFAWLRERASPPGRARVDPHT